MVNGATLRDAVISGANNILNNKKHVDDLNIFPVPDGDTGTNMSMTITAARDEIASISDDATVAEVAKKTASAMLRGARGNSGVISSLLFRGFSKGLEGMEEADGHALVHALSIGVEAAYKAVMKPTEGTILTVARVASEVGTNAAEIDNDPVYVWGAVCEGGAEALADTPNLLPVLKKAGVVDAGGKGILLILEGMLSVFKDGVIIEEDKENNEVSKEEETAQFFASVAAEFDEVINFTYCTEFIVGRDPECDKDPLELRLFLETIGDCVVVVDDEDIIKTHVHTENPGNAIQKALEYGQLLKVKIENMKEQHRKAQEENEKAKKAFEAKQAPKKEKLPKADPEDEFGFVSVAAGEGVQELFKDLGCTHIVSGGQTMNPSTDDILEAILATPAKVVYVLPNNKNIIMAAEQAIPMVEDRRVVVIPTRTIPQGISAMLAFDDTAEIDDNREAMMDAARATGTGLVTFAARDSEYGGKKIRENDILGLVNGKMEYVEKSPADTLYKIAKHMVTKTTGFITIIYGNGVTEEEAQSVCDRISKKFGKDVEVQLVNGGQPVYYYILSVE